MDLYELSTSSDQSSSSSWRFTRLLVVLVVVLATVTSGIGFVAAQSGAGDDGGLISTFAATENQSTTDRIFSIVKSNPLDVVAGSLDRALYEAKSLIPDVGPFDEASPPGAADYAADARSYLSERSSRLTEYANTHSPSDRNKSAVNVIKVQFSDDDGDTASWIAVANVTNGNFSNLQFVNSTSKALDYTVSLGSYASQEFTAEAKTVFKEYVSEGKPVGEELIARIGAEFRGQVTVTEGDGS